MADITGLRIRDARKRKRISQKELARRVEISTSYMNLIETGKRPIGGALLTRIGAELDASPAELRARMSDERFEKFTEIAAQYSIDAPLAELFAKEQPVWVSVIEHMHSERIKEREQRNQALDRMSENSALSHEIHDLLTRIASIRSTASILNTQGGIGQAQEAQFRSILHNEALEATTVAESLVRLLTQASDELTAQAQLHQKLDAMMRDEQFLPRWIHDANGAITRGQLRDWLRSEFGETAASLPWLESLFLTLARDRALIPLRKLRNLVERYEWRFDIVAREMDQPIDRVLRATAFYAPALGLEHVALNIIDDFGFAWLFTPEVARLPQTQLECAKWPIFFDEIYRGALSEARVQIENDHERVAFAAHGVAASEQPEVAGARIRTQLSFDNAAERAPKFLPLRAIDANVACINCRITDCRTRRHQRSMENESSKGNGERNAQAAIDAG